MDRLAYRHATIGTAINDKPLTYIDLGCQIRIKNKQKCGTDKGSYGTGTSGPVPRPIMSHYVQV